jgi:hypothetical protein
MDKLTILLDGDARYLDAEVLLKHISRALRGREFAAGIVHQLEIDREGGVRLNGIKVYTPARPLIAKKGA